MYHETKRIIKKAIYENKLIVFIGAGVSVDSGVPLWGDAINKIKKCIESESIPENDYLKIPQFYYNYRGFKEYNELMKEIFTYNGKSPNDLHRKVFELKPSNIITTNYDDFLEKIADECGEFLEVIECDNDIPYAPNNRLLIKMHGGFKYNNYVLKEDDYLNYSINFRLTETLIKALIARNTVLFIGYSFGDPDTKQIFNWVKSALGNDFQRAYMIVADQKYNEVLKQYYQNIGINLIFAEKCIKFEEKNIFQNTLDCLNYLIVDQEALDVGEEIYSKLMQYESLNYILSRYIQSALSKHGGRINKTLIEVREKKLLELFKQINTSEDKTMVKLNEIFLKTCFSSIQEFRGPIPVDEEVKISEIQFDKIYNAIYQGSYNILKEFAEEINVYDENISLNKKFEAAYSFYKIKEYNKAMNILRELSKYCKKNKNLVWNFIAEFNIKNIKQICRNSKEESQNKESSNIQEILYKYNLQSDENNFLLEIANFSLFYYAHYKSSDLSNQVENDKINIFQGGQPGIEKFTYYVWDFYNFIILNNLMVDHYIEIKCIFQNYVKSSISSHMFVPHEISNKLFDIKGKGYSLPQISILTILFAIDYFTYRELIDLFFEYKSKTITIEDNAQEFICIRAENYYNARKRQLIDFSRHEKINNILLIASKTFFDKMNFNRLFKCIILLLKNDFVPTEAIILISNFLVQHTIKDIHLVEESELLELIMFIINSNKNYNPNSINKINILLKNCCSLLHKRNNSYRIDDKIINLNSDESSFVFITVYTICSEVKRKEIENHIIKKLSNEKFNYDLFDLYWNALSNNIIKPIPEVEEKLLRTLESDTSKLSGIVYPNPYQDMLNMILNLKWNDFLIDSSKFDSLFDTTNEEQKFLYDINNFDYSKFEISWIKSFDNNLLMTLVKNDVVKNGIACKIKEEYEKRGLEKDEIDIYFKYFA